VSEEAIVVLEREIDALDEYRKRLDRQLEKFAPESDDARGAHQARDVVQGRITALQAGIAVLKGKPSKGLRP
jgi:prefoldin subunit 5